MRLLFIIGMQKSGTSLLNRMLMQQSFINNPFLPEGKLFWGDNPPFSPVDKPCGELYQKHFGEHGHYLDENDYDPCDKDVLISRINKANILEPILMNKNPYNSVRVKWLKMVFPDCKIIAMYRNPVSTVFSLLKKYVKHHNQGARPDKGWWGIKPKHWKSMLTENKLQQCSNQWSAVNQEILNNVNNIDMMVDYEQLCSSANVIIQNIASLCDTDSAISKMPVCENLNDEYLKGSRLLSKNREFRKNQGFDLNHLDERIEFPVFTINQVDEINGLCNSTWDKLKV